MTPEQRRVYQRARYNSNPEAKKSSALKRYHEQKEKQEKFNGEDYAEEFLFNTSVLGMAARDIISRSKPGPSFFRDDVRFRVTVVRCGSCRRYFDPAVTGTFPECSPECAHLYQWGK